MVILTADHGEMFGESRLYEHRRFLTDSLLEIPLIVSDPDRPATVNQDKVPSVDVPATICDIAEVGPSSVMGRSLFETVSRPVTATCVRRGKRKQRVI